jgi:hypothetical protein
MCSRVWGGFGGRWSGTEGNKYSNFLGVDDDEVVHLFCGSSLPVKVTIQGVLFILIFFVSFSLTLNLVQAGANDHVLRGTLAFHAGNRLIVLELGWEKGWGWSCYVPGL